MNRLSSTSRLSVFVGLSAIIVSGVLMLLTAAGGVWAEPASAPQVLPTETVILLTSKGPVSFNTMIAADDASRQKGLMYRRRMADHQAMIFDFPEAVPVSFWMHNTALGLDIIFIGVDGRITNIAANAKPYDDTPLPSAGPARAVLEIKAGLAKRLGIKVGDRVTDGWIFPK
jgi:uncharacterized membrane protein (UPF0127 family)